MRIPKGWRRLKTGSYFGPKDRNLQEFLDTAYWITIDGYGGKTGPDDFIIRKIKKAKK